MKQLSLFDNQEPEIKLLGNYDSVIVNFSNGIDSTGTLYWALENFPKNKIWMVYCNTGLDYPENDFLFYKTCDFLGLNNRVILKHEKGFLGLLEHRRMFPDAKNRWCTSYLKRDITNKWIRHNRHILGETCLFLTGERRDESAKRSKLKELEIHSTTLKTTRKGKFLAHWYRPVLDYEKGQMFERGKILGIPPHFCYEYVSRCSCMACILMPNKFAIENAKLYPREFLKLVEKEREIAHTWKKGFSLQQIWESACLDIGDIA